MPAPAAPATTTPSTIHRIGLFVVSVSRGPTSVVTDLFEPVVRARIGGGSSSGISSPFGTVPVGGKVYSFDQAGKRARFEVGRDYVSADEVAQTVIASPSGRPVYVRDVAQVTDSTEEPESYTRLGFGRVDAEKPKLQLDLVAGQKLGQAVSDV